MSIESFLSANQLVIQRFLRSLPSNLRALLKPEDITLIFPVLHLHPASSTITERLLKRIYTLSRAAAPLGIETFAISWHGQSVHIAIEPLEEMAKQRFGRRDGEPVQLISPTKRMQAIVRCESSIYPASLFRPKSGKILYANSKVARYNLESDEVIGSQLTDYLRARDVEKIVEHTLKDKQLKGFEFAAKTDQMYWLIGDFELIEYNGKPAILAISQPA